MADIKPHILIIEGRFYDEINNELVTGAAAALDEAGATHEVITVPGALEIPQVFAYLAHAHLAPFGAERWRFHGAVALGCVIRGETSHYDLVANESARALMDIATRHAIPLGNGILTVENEAQAWERAAVREGNKGRDAAHACLRLVDVFMKSHGLTER
jgi:6,7-dimethyl-8-ribityllumazine synthase